MTIVDVMLGTSALLLGVGAYLAKTYKSDEDLVEPERDFEHYKQLCIEQAKMSTCCRSTCCRSKCGSVVVAPDGRVIGYGFNSKPCHEGGACFKDDLSPTFKSDKTCCVHAEQRSLMAALANKPHRVKGGRIFFIRLSLNNEVLHAGRPYCTICSKLALDAGIKEFVLFHEGGPKAYETKHYNDLSFQYSE